MGPETAPAALVTGAAGFIGSHLAERLLRDGRRVVGVDCFSDYYPPTVKRATAEGLRLHEGFDLREIDLASAPAEVLSALLDDVDVVFHLAGQPGVRRSWSEGFDSYVEHNVVATQRLLEACRQQPLRRFVYASSSSVYGQASSYPTYETDLPRPHSPYGVTKLAGEHLCSVYAANERIPTVSLRYFTVYGPRQRPDMAIHRLIEAALGGTPFPLYGTGEQVRDFTFVSDVVEANVLASTAGVEPGSVMNIAGGSIVSLAELLATVGELAGRPVEVAHRPKQAGDVDRTSGSIDSAQALLEWKPSVALEDGLGLQLGWHREMRR